MVKQLSLTVAALAMSASAMIPAAASAQRYGGGYDDQGYGQQYDQGYGQQYERHGRAYRNAQRDGYNQGPRYYEDRNDRPVKRCSNGTTGTIVGAIAGGLLGRTIDSRGDRTLGTVIGGVGGALAGRAIERDGSKSASYDGRCYR